MRASNDGWRGAVIYQVYLRSFFDSDGDGVGDLPGLLVKLDYIASLGVDAIWISPFFTSPMQDFGYDISDYRSVDSLFGTLDDFDAVVRGCHAQNLGVIIDQVLNHTSDQHPWFQASAQDRDNPYADWYVWADPKPDGTPPNNWLSVFGGSAWQWNSRRRQYYLHNFLSCQPDLNYHHPAVRSQILSDVEFWLQRGVDGVRLDAINFCFHDRHLRDNPPAQTPERDGIGVRPDNPYAYQHHRFDKTQPENLAWLQDIRRLLDRYPGRMAMGEIGDDRPLATLAAYTQGAKRLHMAYSFDLLGAHPSKQALHTLLHAYQSGLNDGWPCWAMSNHDVERVASRWGRTSPAPEQLTLYLVLLLTLRGSACLYQGEELGLPEADLDDEARRDPYGQAFWSTFKGRDGCRTPLPWADTPTGGFTTGTPWLPLPPAHRRLSVIRQEAAPDSVLNVCRALIQWRKTQPALVNGSLHLLDTPEGLLAYERVLNGNKVLVLLNWQAKPLTWRLPAPWPQNPLTLPPFGYRLLSDDQPFLMPESM